MKKIALAAALLVATPAVAADNFVARDGNTIIITKRAVDTGSGILADANILLNSSFAAINPATSDLQTTQNTTLAALFKTGQSIGNTYFGARLQDASGNPYGTAGNPLSVNTLSEVNPADVVATPTLNTGTVGNYVEVPVGGAGEVALVNAALPAGVVVQFAKRVGATLYNTSPSVTLPAGAAPPSNFANTFTGTGTDVVFHFTAGGAQYIRETVLTATTGTTAVTWDATAGAGDVNALVPARATGGATPFHLVTTASTNATLVAAGNHTLYSATLTGLNPTAAYVHLIDSATANCAATPTHTYLVIGTATQQGGLVVPLPTSGEAYVSGLTLCVTGAAADGDTSSGPAGVLVNLSYK